MTEVTNADLYGVLLGIKEDIGGLKTSSGLQVQALRNHAERIGVLEGAGNRQKGAIAVWGIIGTAVAGVLGSMVSWFLGRPH